MSTPGTILNEIADGIRNTVLASIPTLKVYSYEPRDIEMDAIPGTTGAVAATILGPTQFSRRSPEDHDSQLGSYDWSSEWLYRIYTQLDDPETSQRDARTVFGESVYAIDRIHHLGVPWVLEAVMAFADEPEMTENETGRQMLRYPCTVTVFTLIPDNI